MTPAQVGPVPKPPLREARTYAEPAGRRAVQGSWALENSCILGSGDPGTYIATLPERVAEAQQPVPGARRPAIRRPLDLAREREGGCVVKRLARDGPAVGERKRPRDDMGRASHHGLLYQTIGEHRDSAQADLGGFVVQAVQRCPG